MVRINFHITIKINIFSYDDQINPIFHTTTKKLLGLQMSMTMANKVFFQQARGVKILK